MSFKIFKNAWVEKTHTAAQIKLAIGFLHFVDKCMGQAQQEALSFSLTDTPKAKEYFRRVEGFTFSERHKEYKGAVRILCAAAGSAIEERVYQLVDGNMDAFLTGLNDVSIDTLFGALSESAWALIGELEEEPDIDMDEVAHAFELAKSDGEKFPTNFSGKGGRKGSRPDIRLALGDGYEALYDLTADTEVSRGHIEKKGKTDIKGGKSSSWLTRAKVPFIAEVYYDLNK